jgi:hypothetical protein
MKKIAILLLIVNPVLGQTTVQIEDEHDWPPYIERVPVQLEQVLWDWRMKHDLDRAIRGLRHALLPTLDRK